MVQYLYTKKLINFLSRFNMVHLNERRSIVEQLVRKTQEEASKKSKKVNTIDPVMEAARKLYPYLRDKELNDCACTALRLILNNSQITVYQTKLTTF
jgi:hypothetical protein